MTWTVDLASNDRSHVDPADPQPLSALAPVSGLYLRYALLLVLDSFRGRTCTIPELLTGVRRLGLCSTAARPGKAVSDALRWEVARGRARQEGRGRYAVGHLPRVTRHRARRAVAELRREHIEHLGDRGGQHVLVPVLSDSDGDTPGTVERGPVGDGRSADRDARSTAGWPGAGGGDSVVGGGERCDQPNRWWCR